jgi:phosphoribosylaminoimidazole-succinocarboxamide synthase
MSDAYIQEVSDRYIELYEHITGKEFKKADVATIEKRIESNILSYLEKR